MEFDRPFRDKEPGRDLGVLESSGEEREHLELLIREYRILTRKGRKAGAARGPRT